MSIDNRTELNDCDTVTGWTGDGSAPAVVTLVGSFYQGTGGIESQHTDTDEHMSTTQESVGATTFSLDLTTSTMYLLLKDNLVSTLALGGVQYVIGDGTNKVGYDVGGNDSSGLPLVPFYNCYKLDVSNLPVAFNAYTGTEAALTQTTITEAGVGTLHLAKAVGNVANITVDYMSYIANGTAALTINGGTIGTPETMVDVQGDDVTNGWGLIANPFGSQYLFMGPTEWGDATTLTSYFTASDEQWFWIGGVAGIGNFDFNLTANATGTNSFVVTNTVIVGLDVRSDFDLAPANHNIMKLTSVTFTDIGVITFPLNNIGNFANNCIFNNCAQVNPSTIDMESPSFNSTTDANGALLIAATVSNILNATFTSGGTGHAIYITATGTYDFDLWTFSGYGADATTDSVVYNNSSGAVTINILNGGDTPTVRNGAGASTTINNSVTVLVQGVTEGAAVKVIEVGSPQTIILEVLADSNGEASTSINFTGDLPVVTRVRSSGLPTAAIQDDNGAFTDETTAANSAVAADMNLLPATPVVNEDRYLFGHAEKFNNMKIGINTAGTGGFTITWQYWNGATWANLAGVIDGTSSFSVTGTNYISFTLPGDWATTTINTTQGPYYYIRAAYTAGTVTIVPLGTRCSLDVNKYLPFVQNGTVTTDGLTVTASWNRDTIATF